MYFLSFFQHDFFFFNANIQQESFKSFKKKKKKDISLREKGTFLSIEILFGLLEYVCLLGEDLEGLSSLGHCRGYLHFPVMSSKEKRMEVEERG